MLGLGAEFPFRSEVHQPCSGSHTDKISEVRWTWNCLSLTLLTLSRLSPLWMEAAAVQPQDPQTTCGLLSMDRGSVPTVTHDLGFQESPDRTVCRWCFCPGWSDLTGSGLLNRLAQSHWRPLTSTHPHLSLHQSGIRWRTSDNYLPLALTRSCESKQNPNTLITLESL